MTKPTKPSFESDAGRAGSNEPNYLIKSFVDALQTYEKYALEDPASGTSEKTDTILIADLPARW